MAYNDQPEVSKAIEAGKAERILSEFEGAAALIVTAITKVTESEQGFGEINIIVKNRKITRIIVSHDTKI